MPKSKKTLEASLDLTPSFMTSVDERVEGLVTLRESIEVLRGKKQKLDCIFEQ